MRCRSSVLFEGLGCEPPEYMFGSTCKCIRHQAAQDTHCGMLSGAAHSGRCWARTHCQKERMRGLLWAPKSAKKAMVARYCS